MLAQIVPASLHITNLQRPKNALQKRHIFEEKLLLQILRAGRNNHALARADDRQQVRQRLAGAGTRLDDEGRRYLSVIRENSRRMGALIDDLLAFSRLGRLPVATREVDMDSLVREVVAEVLEPHGAARPQIELGTLPPAHADPGE